MDVEALRVFVEVMRRGSFAKVARDRDVAASSVSRTIATLEAELGVRLFTRTTRRLTPTEAGTLYFERVEPIVDQLERAGHVAQDVGEEPKGTLRLTAPITFAELHLAPLLPAFSARYPELRFELLFTDRIVDLVDERIDVAVRLGRLAESSLVARKLCDMVYCVCASPAYLARAGSPSSPEDLVDHECLRYPVPGYAARWRFRPKGSTDVVEVPVGGRLQATSSHALRDFALAGMGVLMVPRWNVARELRDGRLVPILEEWEATASVFEIGAWVLYPSRTYLPLKVRVFVDYLAERFSGGGPPGALPPP